MPQPSLSEADLQDTYELVCRYQNVTRAAEAVGINRKTFSARWLMARSWARSRGLPVPAVGLAPPTPEPPPPPPLPPTMVAQPRAAYEETPSRLPSTAEEAWAILDAFIGRARVQVTAPPYQAGETRRYVVASDFHAPFHDPEAVAHLIAQEGGKPDTTLIIAGDFLDLYSISSYSKHERVGIETELAGAEALLGTLAGAFSDILLIEGNHDQRLDRRVRALLPEEMVAALQYLAGGDLSVLRAMCRRYPNVRFNPVQVGRFDVKWCTQVGDIIVSHAEKFSRVPGSAMRGVEEWLSDQEQAMQLDPWRILCQAHTHQLAWIPWRADKLLIELGCMTETHGYQLSAQVRGRPQRRGYCTLTQHKGRTDMHSVRMVWLDPARW